MFIYAIFGPPGMTPGAPRYDGDMTARLQSVAVVLLALASLCVAVACDPCSVARDFHTERCASGESAESCEWLQENIALSGACIDL